MKMVANGTMMGKKKSKKKKERKVITVDPKEY